MNVVKIVTGILAGASVGYTTYRLLEEKTDELVEDGGMINAFIVGAGHMGLSITAGVIAAGAFSQAK